MANDMNLVKDTKRGGYFNVVIRGFVKIKGKSELMTLIVRADTPGGTVPDLYFMDDDTFSSDFRDVFPQDTH